MAPAEWRALGYACRTDGEHYARLQSVRNDQSSGGV